LESEGEFAGDGEGENEEDDTVADALHVGLREDAHDEGCQAELYGGGDDEVAAEGGVVDLGLLVLGLIEKEK
jgi:hypothetical protein